MIYLDHNASAPLHANAQHAMTAAMSAVGNPSSQHVLGQRARGLVEQARTDVAKLVNANCKQLIFTSGATEALHLAIHGALMRSSRKVVLVNATEHQAVIEYARALEARGRCELKIIAVDANGQPDLTTWKACLGQDVAVAAIMQSNHETGVIADTSPICTLARERGVFTVVDAAQAIGKIPVHQQADAIAMSACKIGGPSGVGALVLADGAAWSPPYAGGAQERGRRPGTENLLGIVGFGAAAQAVNLADMPRVRALREKLEGGLRSLFPSLRIHGEGMERLPNTTFAAFSGADNQLLLMLLDQAGVCASSGAACVSGASTPSHVLAAMGVPKELARASIRLSLGTTTTDDDVAGALSALQSCVPKSTL